MEHINFDQIPMQETYGHTSKGNQMKWRTANFWYKADSMGYESLSEILISRLLQYSDIAYPVVQYEPVEIAYRGKTYHGCKSRDFLKPGWSLIPLEKLYRQYTGESLAKKLAVFSEVIDRVRFMSDTVQELTGLQDFGAYLTAMLEIDALFLNVDRHTNNIAVLYHAESDCYQLCPIFDQGLSLLSDTSTDFPLERPLEECLKVVEAKPFLTSFDDQLNAAEELYGIQMHFALPKKAMLSTLAELQPIYGKDICDRVARILRWQVRHLAYLMRTT